MLHRKGTFFSLSKYEKKLSLIIVIFYSHLMLLLLLSFFSSTLYTKGVRGVSSELGSMQLQIAKFFMANCPSLRPTLPFSEANPLLSRDQQCRSTFDINHDYFVDIICLICSCLCKIYWIYTTFDAVNPLKSSLICAFLSCQPNGSLENYQDAIFVLDLLLHLDPIYAT